MVVVYLFLVEHLCVYIFCMLFAVSLLQNDMTKIKCKAIGDRLL